MPGVAMDVRGRAAGMIPLDVIHWLDQNQFGSVTAQQSVSGGCINQSMRLTTQSADRFFLKVNPVAPADMFAREVDGLEVLGKDKGPRVPQPFCFGESFLLMEDLAPAPPRPDYWAVLGRQLATLHSHTWERYGFFQDNYIGSTRQPNQWMADGFAFFSEQRILYMAGLARGRGYLQREQYQQAVNLAAKLAQWVPPQPPSLLHGDLWTGNVLSGSEGEPALIDPAAHYGWAEAELAMTSLFGTFPAEFYQAYQEIRPLEPGFQSRYPIYNLYHLLNHLVLFGRGYLGQVDAILKYYG